MDVDAEQEQPVLTRHWAGVYTGEDVPQPPDQDDDLRILVIELPGSPKRTLDPSKIGGFMQMANLAHRHFVCLRPEAFDDGAGRLQQYLRAGRAVRPCSEMYWNYSAVTDSPQDPLLNVMCFCCGKPMVRLTERL